MGQSESQTDGVLPAGDKSGNDFKQFECPDDEVFLPVPVCAPDVMSARPSSRYASDEDSSQCDTVRGSELWSDSGRFSSPQCKSSSSRGLRDTETLTNHHAEDSDAESLSDVHFQPVVQKPNVGSKLESTLGCDSALTNLHYGVVYANVVQDPLGPHGSNVRFVPPLRLESLDPQQRFTNAGAHKLQTLLDSARKAATDASMDISQLHKTFGKKHGEVRCFKDGNKVVAFSWDADVRSWNTIGEASDTYVSDPMVLHSLRKSDYSARLKMHPSVKDRAYGGNGRSCNLGIIAEIPAKVIEGFCDEDEDKSDEQLVSAKRPHASPTPTKEANASNSTPTSTM